MFLPSCAAILLGLLTILEYGDCCKKPDPKIEIYYEHLGCFADRNDYRDFPHLAGSAKGSLTKENCNDRCKAEKQMFYFALTNGDTCYCGAVSYGRYGQVDQSFCDKPCSGDHQYSCGGYLYNDVYKLGVPIVKTK